LALLNIQAQWIINKLGEIVAKDCPTHDQSFKWESSGTSVNSRCNSDKNPKMRVQKMPVMSDQLDSCGMLESTQTVESFQKRRLHISSSSLPSSLGNGIKNHDPNSGKKMSFMNL
jgi:hypothetical protein